MPTAHIRNFCIIAHIDHGKSTLADRLLELTKTVPAQKMRAQFLDQMDLEREKGITIKLQPVRMNYKEYELNLIDTPGHVDFSYEVSRSLAACEGALLVVDAVQGVQAQTLANLYMAIEQGLEIVPIINKIDLSNARIKEVEAEIVKILGVKDSEILKISAKRGTNVEQVLDAVITRLPPPPDNSEKPLRALIFDSEYNTYQGAVAYIRVADGQIKRGDRVKFMAANKEAEVLEVGVFKPWPVKIDQLSCGEVGYVAAGLKKVADCKVGDTVAAKGVKESLPGYKKAQPMVFASFYPIEGDDFEVLREALEKLTLNDAALVYETESSPALGRGFRCGFLGLLHMEIVQERLRREFDLNLVITTPSVAYKVILRGQEEGEGFTIHSPQELPDPGVIQEIKEPWIKIEIIAPTQYLGQIMELVLQYRGIYKSTEYLDPQRVLLHYEAPLASIIIDFYDSLKGISSGYASMNYELFDWRISDLIKLDILVGGEIVDAFARIVPRGQAYQQGRRIVKKLKEAIPQHNFLVTLQAAIGGKIIARENISALRKDVTAKLYGGDVTRKRKLLEKQKKGKKRMKMIGKVNIPQKAFLTVLKR